MLLHIACPEITDKYVEMYVLKLQKDVRVPLILTDALHFFYLFICSVEAQHFIGF